MSFVWIGALCSPFSTLTSLSTVLRSPLLTWRHFLLRHRPLARRSAKVSVKCVCVCACVGFVLNFGPLSIVPQARSAASPNPCLSSSSCPSDTLTVCHFCFLLVFPLLFILFRIIIFFTQSWILNLFHTHTNINLHPHPTSQRVEWAGRRGSRQASPQERRHDALDGRPVPVLVLQEAEADGEAIDECVFMLKRMFGVYERDSRFKIEWKK